MASAIKEIDVWPRDQEFIQNLCAPTSNMPDRLSSLISVTGPAKPSIVSVATRIKGQCRAKLDL